MSKYIANALSPAQVVKVELEEAEKSALVLVPQNQLSLAIGKEGQNARLAAKLTGWRIDIKPVTAGAAAAAVSGSYNRSSGGEDDFARLARAALSREAERAETNMQASFAKAAAMTGMNFDDDAGGDGDSAPAAPQGETRKVRKDGTFSYNGTTLGPLPPHLANQTVSLLDNGQRLLVMWGDELIRAFRADEYSGGEDATDEGEEGSGETEAAERETRKVRKDRMVVFRNQTYGPLPEQYVGQQVELEINSEHLDIYAEGELIDSYLVSE
jgi:N utilization substance protein A